MFSRYISSAAFLSKSYSIFSEKDFFIWREHEQASAGFDEISYIYTNRGLNSHNYDELS